MKKVISLFLSIIMLLSCMSALPFNALAAEVETQGTLTEGVEATISRKWEARKFYYYSFLPEESGTYLIKTHDEIVQNIIPALYDEDLNVIDDSVYQRDKNDTVTQRNRFFSAENLEKGKTYYIGVYIIHNFDAAGACATLSVSKHTHNYVHGICLDCEKADTDYVPEVNTLATGVPFENEFMAPGEVQHYTFTPEVSGCYHITISSSDINYTVKNSAGESVVNRNTSIYTDLEGGETYSVEIKHNKKKLSAYTYTISLHEHNYIHGYCKECGRYDPDYVAPVPELEVGVPCEGALTRVNEINEFTFTPETDGYYAFSYDDKNVMVKMTLLDEKKQLFSNCYYPQYAELTAGKTYTLQISWWTSYSAGPYTVLAEKHEHDFHFGYCSACEAKDESYVADNVALELDKVYSDEAFTTVEEHSYTFTTDEAGLYDIKTTASSFNSFEATLTDAEGNVISPVASRVRCYFCYDLQANTAYYLKLKKLTEKSDFTVVAKKHTHNIEDETTPSTCKTEGKSIHTCSYGCGYSETEILPINPDGHQFVNGTCRLCGAVDEAYVKTVTEAQLNKRYDKYNQYAGDESYYAFTPEESGTYEFSATANHSYGQTVFTLTDENENRIMRFTAERRAVSGYAELEAGKTYLLTMAIMSDDSGQDFTIYKHTHSYTLTQTKKATCNEVGYEKKACKCGDSIAEYTEATGNHTFKETIVAPTCISDGYTEYACTVCDIGYRKDYVPADPNAHRFVNGFCKYCNKAQPDYAFTDLKYNQSTSFTLKNEDEERYFRYIPKDTGYYTIKSTGRADPYCELYDEDMNELNEADDISDSNYNFAVSAYFEKGKTYYLLVGIFDGENKTITLRVTDHTHKYETETVKPTCGSMGATIKYCDCGYYDITDIIEPSGKHSYKLEEKVEPTCVDKGYSIFACTVCGHMYTDNETEPTGIHEYENKVCVNCDARKRGENKVFDSPIHVGESLSVNFSTLDDIAYFTFVPEVSGSYTFETTGYADTYAELADESGKVLASDDDSALADNARICAEFTEGQKYTFTVDVADLKECTFTVKLYEHTHSLVSHTVPATCNEEGYTEYTCTDCFYKSIGNITAPTGIHHYVNGICDVCADIDPDYNFEHFNDGETKTISGTTLNVYSFAPLHSGEGELLLANGVGVAMIVDKNGNPIAPTDNTQNITQSVKATFTRGEKYFIVIIPMVGTLTATLRCDFEHTFADYTMPSTCIEKGYTCKKCTVCGYEKDKESLTTFGVHAYRRKMIVTPTYTEEGVYKFTCDICGEFYTEAIPVLKDGWVELDGNTYYYKDGKYLTGWQTIDGKRYLFANANGIMLHDRWYSSNGYKWYLGSDGAAYVYTKVIDGKTYYFNGAGVMQKGWINFSGQKKYFGADGAMVKYTQVIDGKTYYFNGAGVMQTGWINFSGNKKYFGTDGVMKTGWQTINNKRYLFANADGTMLHDRWYASGNYKWYLGSDGAAYTYLKTVSGKTYYFNGAGVMQRGWVKFGSQYRYFDSDGSMLKSTSRKIGAKTYKFDASGICTNY